MLSMTWVCTGLVYDVTTAVRSYVQPLCCVQKTVFPCSCLPPQDLTLFPPSLPQWLVSLGKRGCSNCVLHRDEHSEDRAELTKGREWANQCLRKRERQSQHCRWCVWVKVTLQLPNSTKWMTPPFHVMFFSMSLEVLLAGRELDRLYAEIHHRLAQVTPTWVLQLDNGSKAKEWTSSQRQRRKGIHHDLHR